MRISKRIKSKQAGFAGVLLICAGLTLIFGGSGIQPAAADTQYGILGRQAPELELDSWIDGNGKPMDPVRLKDYRGKVVYLYFFQDW